MQFKICDNTGFFLRMAIAGTSGSGKAQPLDAKVLTPTGWKRMGDLRLGDRIVSSSGGFSSVTAIHPQGEKAVFRVTFTDGSATECCDDHLWHTQSVLDRATVSRRADETRRKKVRVAKRTRYRQARGMDIAAPVTRRASNPRVPIRLGNAKPLSEIRQSIRRYGKLNHWIPMVRPVEFEETSLPLDPYLLAVLLGDGHFGEHSVSLCNPDSQIIDAVRRLLPDGVALRPMKREGGIGHAIRRESSSGSNPVLEILRSLGLSGHLSVDKFIPEQYKFASVQSRIALLQGLLDTDGYCNGHQVEFSTSSPRLADDFQFLINSLGGTVGKVSRIPKFTHKGVKKEGARNWRFYVCLPPEIAPFRLERKAASYIPRTKYLPRRAVVSVEAAGTKVCQCITVDAPDSLYVTDDCLLTHNSFSALRIATELGYEKIGAIDTENKSLRRYARSFSKRFLSLELTRFSPKDYIEAIRAAEEAGIEVLVIDSLSHAWMGKGGVLELVDQAARRSQGNNFAGWRTVTPEHNRLVEAIVQSQMHLIATMRTKVEYVVEKDEKSGKSTPRKVGMAPIQKEGLEFEFDVVAEMNADHDLIITKSRCHELSDAVINRPGAEIAQKLRSWVDGGGERQQETPMPEESADHWLQRLNAVQSEVDLAQVRADLNRLPSDRRPKGDDAKRVAEAIARVRTLLHAKHYEQIDAEDRARAEAVPPIHDPADR